MATDPNVPVEVSIDRVLVFRESGTVGVAIKHPTKLFVIFVGQVEGAAIDRELRKVRADRPMTHDLMEFALRGFDIGVTRAVISSVHNGVYCASLILSQQLDSHRNEVRLDTRASDAMVFALKWGVPLMVTTSVLETVEDFTEQLAMLDSKDGDGADEEDDGEESDDDDDDDDELDDDEFSDESSDDEKS